MTVLTEPEVAQALTTWFTHTQWLPFTESERADISGPGHQDKFAFVAAVNAFDTDVDPDPPVMGDITPDQVDHQWAIVTQNADEEVRIRIVEEGSEEGAVLVTTIWGVR